MLGTYLKQFPLQISIYLIILLQWILPSEILLRAHFLYYSVLVNNSRDQHTLATGTG